MRKKIETELKSLATEILQLADFTDVAQLHQKSLELYEKLTLLKFVDNYFETRFEAVEISFSPSKIEEELKEIENKQAILEEEFLALEAEENLENQDFILSDEELIEEELIEEELIDEELIDEELIEEELIEEELIEKELIEEELIEDEMIEETTTFINYRSRQLSLEEELENSISADVAANLFEKSVRVASKQVSLNDKLQNGVIQVGLNDRIAFVKYLFNGSQEDYNRVLSQLNSFDNEDEAKDFLLNIVKPDYYWDDKFEYEQRFLFLIERKFL